jgi:hypothetical protein
MMPAPPMRIERVTVASAPSRTSGAEPAIPSLL